MAPKPLGKWEKYGKRYCRDWERETGLKEWIRSVPGDDTKAACKYCACEIRAHHSDLVAHSKTKKHKRHVALFSHSSDMKKHSFEFEVENQNSFDDDITQAKLDQSVNVCALKLAAHIACHMSIFTVDHLGCIVGGIAEKDISLHKTKCSTLIRNVIGPTVHKELLRDIGNGHYSLIIDESTDVSAQKQLCLIVRYFSNKLKCIVSSFAGIINLTRSGTITEALLTFLNDNKLNIKRGDHIKLKQQWRNLDAVSWTNTEDSQIEQFWIEVAKHTDEVGDKDFVELGLFALALLTLPFSTAAVECTISQMNLIKTKLKNRLQDSLLENILRIRAYMHRNKICCNQFQPSKEMISLFNNEFYAIANSKDATDDSEEDIF
ncbi:uncharacterized protein [Lepidochelys kempii]|uniref:uncharacterized protein isoform X4 n=1 Tax=Lepidochelys kempii TaxID=8472 RepID=UPI002094D996|nr:uncharacterized protein LOC125645156 isoform X2 [Caretta caretta]